MNNLISKDYLNKHLNDEAVVIIDCRFNLAEPEQGEKDYQQDHIPGAFYLDLEKDLSSEVRAHGGRHPLPNRETFIKKLEEIGVNETKHVIAYDDQDGPFAARLWWLLKYLGHPKVSVLNGNYSGWKALGYATSKELPEIDKTDFKAVIQSEMITDIDQVKEMMVKESYKLVDARAPERYSGEAEPMDKKAGHIPGAENYFWKETRTDYGEMKSTNELKEYFSSLDDSNTQPVVYCGSGVTASATVLALDNIGVNAKLYPGSWSDWASYDDNEVATGVE